MFAMFPYKTELLLYFCDCTNKVGFKLFIREERGVMSIVEMRCCLFVLFKITKY